MTILACTLAVAFESAVAVVVLCGEGSDDEDEDVKLMRGQK